MSLIHNCEHFKIIKKQRGITLGTGWDFSQKRLFFPKTNVKDLFKINFKI